MGKCFSKDSRKKKMAGNYKWQQDLLENRIMKNEQITNSAIVGYENMELQASSPRSFNPDKQAVNDVIAAFNGKPEALIEKASIDFGCGTNVITPGKIGDEGKVMACADGKGGGCAICRSTHSMLIVMYSEKPAITGRLAMEAADFMTEQGH